MTNQKAEKYYQNNDAQKAVKTLVAAIKQNPMAVDNYLQLSTYLIDQGDVDQAIELLTKAQQKFSTNKAVTYNLAVAQYYGENYATSLQLLATLPKRTEVLYQYGLNYYQLKDYKKALAFTLTAQQERSQDVSMSTLLIEIWLALGNLTEAKRVFGNLPPEVLNAKLYFFLGIIELQNHPDAAKEAFRKAQDLDVTYYQSASKQYEALLQRIRGQKHD